MKYYDAVTDFIFVSDEPQDADVIFVPGGAYPEIAERAAVIWGEGFARHILPSGKFSILGGAFDGPASKKEQYPGTYETEWAFLRDVLVRNGVPEEAILREEQATYTYENALYSKQVADSAGLQVRKAILCCQAYHARRALMYFQYVFPGTTFFVCPAVTQGVGRDTWVQSESGIRLVLGELSRIGRQFPDMMV